MVWLQLMLCSMFGLTIKPGEILKFLNYNVMSTAELTLLPADGQIVGTLYQMMFVRHRQFLFLNVYCSSVILPLI